MRAHTIWTPVLCAHILWTRSTVYRGSITKPNFVWSGELYESGPDCVLLSISTDHNKASTFENIYWTSHWFCCSEVPIRQARKCFQCFERYMFLHHSKKAGWSTAILSATSSISPPLPRSSSLPQNKNGGWGRRGRGRLATWRTKWPTIARSTNDTTLNASAMCW